MTNSMTEQLELFDRDDYLETDENEDTDSPPSDSEEDGR